MAWSQEKRSTYRKEWYAKHKGKNMVEERHKERAKKLKDQLEEHQKTIFTGGYDAGSEFAVVANEGEIL